MVEIVSAGCLLGRHVGRRSHRHAETGERITGTGVDVGMTAGSRGPYCLRDPEISDARRVARKKNVVGLDVPVDDVVLMGVLEGARNVAQDVYRFRHFERATKQS